MTAFDRMIARERRRQYRGLLRGCLYAVIVAMASVILLGLSGWFITAAAIAGLAGSIAAQGFNYMLPSAGIRLLAIARTGARYAERLASHDAAFAAFAHIRPALFLGLATGPVSSALALTRGEATARIVQDVDMVEAQFVRLSAPAGTIAALSSGLCLCAIGGWRPALATLICLGSLLAIAAALSHWLDRPGRDVQRATGQMKEAFAGVVEAAAELRCYGIEAQAMAMLDGVSQRLADAQWAQARVSAWFDFAQATALGIAGVSALLLATPAGAPIGALCALTAVMTIDGAAPLLRSFAQRSGVMEARARIDALLPQSEAKQGPEKDGAPISTPDPQSCIVLRGTPLPAGSSAALVGISGSGKTTLVEMLLGLRVMPTNIASLDGRDIATLPVETRRATFGWAPQDAALLAGTIRENLAIADARADDAAMWSVLDDVALVDKVRALPDGLCSWIGEQGARLSGGERRRLALARALLAPAPWLLLDEPTEGLDAATERHIAARLNARRGRTGQGVIMISHRPAMTALCDRHIAIAAAGGADTGTLPPGAIHAGRTSVRA